MARKTSTYGRIVREYYESSVPNEELIPLLVEKVKVFVSAKRPISEIFADIFVGTHGYEQPHEMSLTMFEALRARGDCAPVDFMRLFFKAGVFYNGDAPSELHYDSEERSSFFREIFRVATFDQWMETLRYVYQETPEYTPQEEIFRELLEHWCPTELGEKTRLFADALGSAYLKGSDSIFGDYEEKEWAAFFCALELCHKAEQGK